MAEEKIARIAKEIYENVGGEQNVRKVIHCMTRVRMTIIDNSKVNLVGDGRSRPSRCCIGNLG